MLVRGAHLPKIKTYSNKSSGIAGYALITTYGGPAQCSGSSEITTEIPKGERVCINYASANAVQVKFDGKGCTFGNVVNIQYFTSTNCSGDSDATANIHENECHATAGVTQQSALVTC